jgi:hypothetical protein
MLGDKGGGRDRGKKVGGREGLLLGIL